MPLLFIWCGQQDSNLHGKPLEPKSNVSTNSTMPADNIIFLISFCVFLLRRATRPPPAALPSLPNSTMPAYYSFLLWWPGKPDEGIIAFGKLIVNGGCIFGRCYNFCLTFRPCEAKIDSVYCTLGNCGSGVLISPAWTRIWVLRLMAFLIIDASAVCGFPKREIAWGCCAHLRHTLPILKRRCVAKLWICYRSF